MNFIDFFQDLVNFIVVYVIGRHIAAPWLASWIKRTAEAQPQKYERFMAITRHHLQGHSSKSVIGCPDSGCAVFMVSAS